MMKTQALQDALIELVSAAMELEKARSDASGFEPRQTTVRLDQARQAFDEAFSALTVIKSPAQEPEALEPPEWALDFPPVPDGYDRWEYRGFGFSTAESRWIAYAGKNIRQWAVRDERAAGCKRLIYLEAVR